MFGYISIARHILAEDWLRGRNCMENKKYRIEKYISVLRKIKDIKTFYSIRYPR